jgi:hypothetical protein
MEFLVDTAETLGLDVGVDLGGGEAGVTEHLLDDAEVGSMGEEMGGKGVTKEVGIDPFGDSCGFGGILDHFPSFLTGEGFSGATQKKGGAGVRVGKGRSSRFQIDSECFDGTAAEGDETFFFSFSCDPDDFFVEIDGFQRDADHFMDTESGGVKQFEKGPVAMTFGGVGEGEGEELIDFALGERFGEVSPEFGDFKGFRGIIGNSLGLFEKAKEMFQGNDIFFNRGGISLFGEGTEKSFEILDLNLLPTFEPIPHVFGEFLQALPVEGLGAGGMALFNSEIGEAVFDFGVPGDHGVRAFLPWRERRSTEEKDPFCSN